MADVQNNSDIAAMSFEQALDQLEKVVDDLERGDVPLEHRSALPNGAKR